MGSAGSGVYEMTGKQKRDLPNLARTTRTLIRHLANRRESDPFRVVP